MSDENLPARLMIDAWTGGTPDGALGSAVKWTLEKRLAAKAQYLRPPDPADPRDWRNPAVGWGLVLGDRQGASAADMATADDQPKPIRRLVKARTIDGVKPPIFRFNSQRDDRYTALFNYATD